MELLCSSGSGSPGIRTMASPQTPQQSPRAASGSPAPHARATSPPGAPSRQSSALVVAIYRNDLLRLQHFIQRDEASIYELQPGGHNIVTTAVAALNPQALYMVLATGMSADLPDRFGRSALRRLVQVQPTIIDDADAHFQRRVLLARMLAAAGAVDVGEEPADRVDAVVRRAALHFHDDLTVALMPRDIKSIGWWRIVLGFLRPQRC